jgi:hypothetical protein
MEMRRKEVGVALAAVGVLVARASAPRLHARLMAVCERMFEQMPDTLPPKRMMRGIEEIRANSARTLALLEAQQHARETEPPGESSPAEQRARRLETREEEELAGIGASFLAHDPSPDAQWRENGEHRTDHSAG